MRAGVAAEICRPSITEIFSEDIIHMFVIMIRIIKSTELLAAQTVMTITGLKDCSKRSEEKQTVFLFIIIQFLPVIGIRKALQLILMKTNIFLQLQKLII